MTSIWHDVRYALRMIARAPGHAAIVVLTLALGIGANTTIFSWINAALLNPVPGLENPREVVSLSLSPNATSPFPFTYPDLEAMRDGQQTFTGLTAVNIVPMSLTGKGKPQRVWGMLTSANYFDVLGVRPVLGRGFAPEEDARGAAPVAVISYRLWLSHFAGRPDVVGQTMALNERPYTVVGVAPAIFQGSQTGVRSDIFVPLMMQSSFMANGDLIHDHHYFWLFVLGRLKPGVTVQQAQAEMTLRLKPEVQAYPEEHRGHEAVTAYPLWRSPWGINLFFAPLLPLLMAISSFVLLLACANVANLMLVRSVARRREIAIRVSLGASRGRLVRQLLVESVTLALAGGAVAVLITLWTSGAMMRFIPAVDFPIHLAVSVDRTVLAAAVGMSVLTGLVFGILPALRASREAPVAVLKEDGGSAGGVRKARLTGGLVVVQVSLSLLLLICAGLLVRSFLGAQQVVTGYNSRGISTVSYDLFPAGYSEEQGLQFDRDLLARLETMPGVQSVMLSNRLPLTFGGGSTSVKPEGFVPPPDVSMETQVAIVSPNYFRTVQMSLAKGRDFTPQDDKNARRVAIVNQTFVDRYWPGQEAIGRQLISDLTNETFTVVGVAPNGKYNQLGEAPIPFLYLPLYQVYRAGMTISARVAGDPLAFGQTAESVVHALNPDVLVFDLTTLESHQQLATVGLRLGGTFIGTFGLLALVLAAVGIYGVTSYSTRQRTREIGIRVALGAGRADILRLVLARGMMLTAVGVGAGLALAFLVTRFLGALLLGITATDVLTYSAGAVLLGAVALLACFLPARRAMRVDPIVALRQP